MKFRFYITNTFEGRIEGTNSESDALSFAASEDFFVVDTERGVWLTPDDEVDIEDYGD